MSSIATVRAGVIQILENYPAITAIVGDRVFDGALPEDIDTVVYPYIVVGYSLETDYRPALQNRGDDHVLAIRTWDLKREGTEWRADARTIQLVELVIRALVTTPMTLEDHRVVSFRRELAEILPSPDPKISSASVQFRVLVRRS